MQNDKDTGKCMSKLLKFFTKLFEAFQPVYESPARQPVAQATPPAAQKETYNVFPSLLEQTTSPIYSHLAGNIHHSSIYDDLFKNLS